MNPERPAGRALAAQLDLDHLLARLDQAVEDLEDAAPPQGLPQLGESGIAMRPPSSSVEAIVRASACGRRAAHHDHEGGLLAAREILLEHAEARALLREQPLHQVQLGLERAEVGHAREQLRRFAGLLRGRHQNRAPRAPGPASAGRRGIAGRWLPAPPRKPLRLLAQEVDPRADEVAVLLQEPKAWGACRVSAGCARP